jgi:hypothetical protein
MRNEKKYLEDLVAELKKFFTLEMEEREKAAMNLNDNWQFDTRDYSKMKDWQKKASNIKQEDNSKISKETEDIVSSLLVLHHYADDPQTHDEMIAQILKDTEERLAILEAEEEEAEGKDNKEKKDKKEQEERVVLIEDDDEYEDLDEETELREAEREELGKKILGKAETEDED